MEQWKTVLLAAILGLVAAPALAAFDTELVVQPASSKSVKIQKPGGAQDYIDHVAIYVRFISTNPPSRPEPVFISTHNYLTCPDAADKRFLLNDVKEVNADRHSGVRILALFFEKPPCEKAQQYFEAITGD